jgi:hypothetical protein
MTVQYSVLVTMVWISHRALERGSSLIAHYRSRRHSRGRCGISTATDWPARYGNGSRGATSIMATSTERRSTRTTSASQEAGATGLLSGSNHDLGDQPVRLRPGVGQIGHPQPTEEMLQGGQQARPDRCVVLSDHREATVVTTQLLEQRHHVVDLVDVRHDSAQGGHSLLR